MENQDRLQRLVSAALLHIRSHSPFFATLALFARIEPAPDLPTAATDGRDIFLNPRYFAGLPAAQRAGLLLHEVLHAALLHVPRRGQRDALLWNIAADIVVNGAIAAEGQYELPPGAVRAQKLEHLTVEEVYHIIQTDRRYQKLVVSLAIQDLLQGRRGAGGILDEQWRAGLEEHWRNALAQAETIAHALHQGTAPAGLARELGALRRAQLDWRSYLWRFLVRTPTDFQGFDRRFIGRGLYLEALDGESVEVYVAVDTSGSVGKGELNAFLSEVRGILGAYPHLRCHLYYADAACYGPFELGSSEDIPPPKGGGGTDFRPFFEAVARETGRNEASVAIYLTDGHGKFPSAAPDMPVLWVLTPGGIDYSAVPFGEAVRLVADA